MKARLLLTTLFSALMILTFASIPEHSLTAKASASHESSTGAPGESTCAAALCHDTTPARPQDSVGAVSELIINELTDNFDYNKKYNVTLRVIRPGLKRAGFQIVALDETYSNAGRISPLANSSTTQLQQNQVFGFNRRYITHKVGGITPIKKDTIEWKFTWESPVFDVGNVTFYYAINIANKDNTNKNDTIITHQVTIKKPGASSITSEANADIRIVPNPAHTMLSIAKNGQEEKFTDAYIFNMLGKEVSHISTSSGHGETLQSLDIRDLQKGVYTLLLYTEQRKQYRTTFIKE